MTTSGAYARMHGTSFVTIACQQQSHNHTIRVACGVKSYACRQKVQAYVHPLSVRSTLRIPLHCTRARGRDSTRARDGKRLWCRCLISASAGKQRMKRACTIARMPLHTRTHAHTCRKRSLVPDAESLPAPPQSVPLETPDV